MAILQKNAYDACMNMFFVGICGTGMSNLAIVLKLFGHTASGSDVSTDFYTADDLSQYDIPIYPGMDPSRITASVDMLIYSAAYSTVDADPPGGNQPSCLRTEHPEIQKAISLGIPVLSYSEMAAQLSGKFTTICIAGTHGKTTTSLMTAAMLHELGIPAAVLAGTSVNHHRFLGKFGLSPQQDGSGRMKSAESPVLILESCEYRKHFLLYEPDILVLTAVDYDHVDYYSAENDYIAAFAERIDRTDPEVPVIFSPDDKGSAEAVQLSGRKYGFIQYGKASGSSRFSRHRRDENSVFPQERITPDESLKALDYSIAYSSPGKTRSREYFYLDKKKVFLSVPGEAMEYDAAAAYAACLTLADQRQIPAEAAAQAAVRGAESYKGSRRRFECIGSASGVLFYDDYAHHPAEITAVLQSFRLKYPGKRIIVDFIPHTISRTKHFLSQFAGALKNGADSICIQEIYASVREKHIEGSFSSRVLAEMMPGSHFFPDLKSAEAFLAGCLRSGDLFITLGAGDNRVISEHLYERFSERDPEKSEIQRSSIQGETKI